MSDPTLPKPYLRRVLAMQAIGITAAFFTIWFAVGGLAGALLAGIICGLNALSLKMLLYLIRQNQ